ncbi:MAG: thioredoxin domain-containing protein [bacterium]|nr:thioredoxin domain-containing protein [bacterium]MDZ4284746.1 thioredoxin domain-containing protein [Patescibacteria group bacterium]
MENDTIQKEAGVGSSTSHTAAVSLSIIFAGALVAAAVYFSDRGGSIARAPEPAAIAAAQDSQSLDNMRPISERDHIRGNPNAPLKIVEYSDMECPFCKRFHPTLKQVMDEYGKDGTVAWIYRHFPLDTLHSKARAEAIASECAAESGGNTAFWAYLDRFYELTPSNDQTDIKKVLPQIASEIGLDVSKFNFCLTAGNYDAHVQDDLDDAIATGGNGTPWSIIITESGKKYPLSGGLPYASVKQLIDLALKEEEQP